MFIIRTASCPLQDTGITASSDSVSPGSTCPEAAAVGDVADRLSRAEATRHPVDHRAATARHMRLPRRGDEALAFATVEEAWFWFVQARQAQLDGARLRAGHVRLRRPCEPLDILTIVDRLFRKRRLLREHLMVLAFYGHQQMPPDPERRTDAHDAVVWAEALAALEGPLRAKGLLQ